MPIRITFHVGAFTVTIELKRTHNQPAITLKVWLVEMVHTKLCLRLSACQSLSVHTKRTATPTSSGS